MIILGVLAAALLLVLALSEKDKELKEEYRDMLLSKRHKIQQENDRKNKCKKKI